MFVDFNLFTRVSRKLPRIRDVHWFGIWQSDASTWKNSLCNGSRDRFEPVSQVSRVAEHHSPRPNFAVAGQDYADRPANAGSGCVSCAAGIRHVILRESDLPEFDGLVGSSGSVRLAFGGVHEPERAVFLNQPVAPPSRRCANAAPIGIGSNACRNRVLRGIGRAGVSIRVPPPTSRVFRRI